MSVHNSLGFLLFLGVSIYRTHVITISGLYIFYPIFEDHFFVFMEFFQKILALCMDSAQEQFVIKSELLCQAYGICTSLEYNPT